MTVSCLDCGFVFENEDHNYPCPQCGSHNRSITVTDQITAYELLKVGKREATYRKHKHEFDEEITTGEKVGKDGKRVSIERVIDREHDVYIESVKDEQGKTIVQKREKLSEHR